MTSPSPLRLGLAIVAVLTVALLGACTGDEGETVVDEAEDAGTGELLVGEQVRIEGRVEEVLTDEAFTLGADETLVLDAEEPGIDEEDAVIVRGEVVEVAFADLAADGIDLDEERFAPYEDELALVAETVEVVDENQGRTG